MNLEQGAPHPCITLYAVSVPESEATNIGTTRIVTPGGEYPDFY